MYKTKCGTTRSGKAIICYSGCERGEAFGQLGKMLFSDNDDFDSYAVFSYLLNRERRVEKFSDWQKIFTWHVEYYSESVANYDLDELLGRANIKNIFDLISFGRSLL